MLLIIIGGCFSYSAFCLINNNCDTSIFYLINATNIFFIIGFLLNRRGNFLASSILSIAIFSLSIIALVYIVPTNIHYLFLMIIPLLMGSMLFTLKGAFILTVCHLIGMLGLILFNSNITFNQISIPLILFLVVATMLLLFIHHRNQLENYRQNQLEKNEAQYRSLVENINEVIYTIDTNGCFTFISPVIEKITHYKVEDIIGQPFSLFIAPEDLPEVEANVRKILSGTGKYNEFRVVDKNKKILHFCTYSQILQDHEKPIGVIGVLTDKTIQTELQDQLHHAQKLESVGRLAGGIAHDFNNILTVIIGYCEILLNEEFFDDNCSSLIKSIRDAAERAASLTQQLLTFSRKQIIQPIILNMNDLIKNLKEMLQRLIGEHITLNTHLESSLELIRVDPAQLEQVIMNLVVNSRDAMPKGGKLTIKTSNSLLGENYYQQYKEVIPGQYVKLSIIDTGHGFDEKIGENIFDPFFTTKDSGKGTGLGLSTAYGIVKQSGGHIWFNSEIDKGTTFDIYFPAVDDCENSEYTSNQMDNYTLETVRGEESLLVVEDQEDLREMIVDNLRLYGYQVEAVPNGIKALQLCKNLKKMNKTFDLIITDVLMPEMNGKELADNIVHLYPEVKILFMSGYTEQAIVDHKILLEEMSFLPKPFSPSALIFKVRNLLDKR